jgi:hypothetical protein
MGDSSEIREQNEGFMEHVGMTVTGPIRTAVGVGSQHVVVCQEVVVAKGLCGLCVVSYADRISADLGLGKDDS